MTNRYLGAAPSTREAARLAWRARVGRSARYYAETAAAVRCYLERASYDGRGYGLQGLIEEREAAQLSLDAALSAPRPWRSAGRPTPRRRYSRAHRKGCAVCNDIQFFQREFPSVWRSLELTKNPHGKVRA